MSRHFGAVTASDQQGDSPAGKISSVEAQQKRRGRVNVHIDDHFAFSLSEVVAVRAGLRPGLILSSADVARLTGEDSFQVTLDSALRFLSHRQRSELELRQNLTRKGATPELIEAVLDRLRELKLLDDAAFAQFWVDNRDRFNPRGAMALRSELLQKGVSRLTVDEAILEGSDEAGRARDLALKKLARFRSLEYRDFVHHIVALLARRGFSYQIAYATARSLWDRPVDEDADVDGDA